MEKTQESKRNSRKKVKFDDRASDSHVLPPTVSNQNLSLEFQQSQKIGVSLSPKIGDSTEKIARITSKSEFQNSNFLPNLGNSQPITNETLKGFSQSHLITPKISRVERDFPPNFHVNQIPFSGNSPETFERQVSSIPPHIAALHQQYYLEQIIKLQNQNKDLMQMMQKSFPPPPQNSSMKNVLDFLTSQEIPSYNQYYGVQNQMLYPINSYNLNSPVQQFPRVFLEPSPFNQQVPPSTPKNSQTFVSLPINPITEIKSVVPQKNVKETNYKRPISIHEDEVVISEILSGSDETPKGKPTSRACFNAFCPKKNNKRRKLLRAKLKNSYIYLCRDCKEAFSQKQYCVHCFQIYLSVHSDEIDGKEWIQCESCDNWVIQVDKGPCGL